MTPERVVDDCWLELASAARERGHPWRVLTLASVADGPDGPAAEARAVVLREADAGQRLLRVYTDARSPKVGQLLRHPQATLLGWWPQRGWQLRLTVRCTVQTDGLDVSSRWERLRHSPAAQDYLSPTAPGSPLVQPATARGARAWFAVIVAEVQGLDWLALDTADGHRRVRADAHGAHWVQP
jgi:hypothetical protein